MRLFRFFALNAVLWLTVLTPGENFDERLFLNLNAPGHPQWDGISTSIYYMQAASLLAAGYTYYLGHKNKNDSLKNAAFFGVYGLGSTLILNQLLKFSFKRTRPIYALKEAKGRHSNDDWKTQIFPSEKYSMPSLSLSLISFSAHYFSDITGYKSLWYSYTVLLAWSRIYEGGHYPGDLLVGVLLGTSTAELFKYLGRKNRASGPSAHHLLFPEVSPQKIGFRYQLLW